MGKIYIVDAEWKADQKVFIVDAEWKADSKEFVVDAEWKSNEKVFIVNAEWKADRKIFLVDAEWKAKKGSGSSSSLGSYFSTASTASNSTDTPPKTNTNAGSGYSSSSNFSSDSSSSESSYSSSSESSSGCGGTLLKWFITLLIIGGVLKYFGLTDQLLGGQSGSTEYRVVADSLNLRSEPDPNSRVVSIIPRDSILQGLNDSSKVIGSNTWIFVSNKMDSGWVNEKYVEEK